MPRYSLAGASLSTKTISDQAHGWRTCWPSFLAHSIVAVNFGDWAWSSSPYSGRGRNGRLLFRQSVIRNTDRPDLVVLVAQWDIG
jgi:hypothetical protein